MKKYFVLLAVLLVGLLAFQNCSQLESGNSAGSSNQETSDGDRFVLDENGDPILDENGDPIVDPIEPAPSDDPLFVAGDVYDPGRITRNTRNLRFTNQLVQYNTGSSLFKAIAVNEDGDGLALRISDPVIVDQAEWSRVTLERCQLAYQKPCALIVEADSFVSNEAELVANYQDMFANISATFDPSQLPGVFDYWRTTAGNNYVTNIQNNPATLRAYAIGRDGGSYSGWSTNSQAEANRMAQQRCEQINLGTQPCFIFAENMDVVWDPTNYQYLPISLQFGPRPFLGTQDIFLVGDTFQGDTELANALSLHTADPENFHFMIIFALNGRVPRVRTSINPIDDAFRAQELAACDQDYITQFGPTNNGNFQPSCFIYSEDMEVVLTAEEYGQKSHHWRQ